MRKRKNMLLAALLGLLLIFTQQAAAFATGEETILSGGNADLSDSRRAACRRNLLDSGGDRSAHVLSRFG